MGSLHLVDESRLSLNRNKGLAVVLISVIILAIYSNTFDAGWHFDDTQNILNHKGVHLKECSWEHVKKAFYNERGRIDRPVAYFSFALNYYFGEDRVFGYHLVNLLIHINAAVFLYLFLRETLNLPTLKAKYGPNSQGIALMAALLWAANPVQTQAVTYIVQRMASMAGMFYIMAMYFYLKARTSDQKGPPVGYLALSLLSSILAFGSKENAAMLPVNVFLLDIFLVQGVDRAPIGRNLYILAAVLATPLLLALLIRGPAVFDLNGLLAGYGQRAFSITEKLLTESRVLLFYVSLLFYPMPHRLNIAHDITLSHSLLEPPTTILSIGVILSVLVVCIARAKAWPLLSYCIIFFFVNHFIESSIFPLELAFEHRNYLPSMLLFTPVALLLYKGLDYFSGKRPMQALILSFSIFIFLALGHSAFLRNEVWKDEGTLWTDAVQKSPGLPKTHHNLAIYYEAAGLKRLAVTEYQKALSLPADPNKNTKYMTHFNLALTYLSMNERRKAEDHLLKAVEIAPSFWQAHLQLGNLKLMAGDFERALRYYQTALHYNKNCVGARNNLGFVFLKKMQVNLAIEQFIEALTIDQNNPNAWSNLGIAYKALGSFCKAAESFRRALELDGKSLMTFLHLIETYHSGEQEQEASDTAKRLLSLEGFENILTLIHEIGIASGNPIEKPNIEIVMQVLSKENERSRVEGNR